MSDHKLSKPRSQLDQEREAYFSQLYKSLQSKKKQPTKFIERENIKFSPGDPSQPTTRPTSKREADPFQQLPELTAQKSTLTYIQPRTEIFSKTFSRSMSTQLRSTRTNSNGNMEPMTDDKGPLRSSKRLAEYLSHYPTPVSSRANSPEGSRISYDNNYEAKLQRMQLVSSQEARSNPIRSAIAARLGQRRSDAFISNVGSNGKQKRLSYADLPEDPEVRKVNCWQKEQK